MINMNIKPSKKSVANALSSNPLKQ